MHKNQPAKVDSLNMYTNLLSCNHKRKEHNKEGQDICHATSHDLLIHFSGSMNYLNLNFFRLMEDHM